MQGTISDSTNSGLLKLEQASTALRRGGAVMIRDQQGRAALCIGAEFADLAAEQMITMARAQPVLCLTGRHLKSFGRSVPQDRPVFSLPARDLAAEQIIALVLGDGALLPEAGGLLAERSGSLPDLACQLMRLAKLLPAALICRTGLVDRAEQNNLATVWRLPVLEARELAELEARPPQLVISTKVKLPLAVAEDAQMVMFRAPGQREEHFAVLVGRGADEAAPLVRLHSQCLTGDILGSLRCDCGPQLQTALARMAEAGGGILIYLAQEGRDIGLLNKMRSYALQEAGLDTVEANHRLGFETDQRQFAPAARMLSLLGVTKLQLMTNNPDKIAQLEQHGLNVTKRVPLILPANAHSERYMETKRARTGHLLDDQNGAPARSKARSKNRSAD